jgi:hypothetical protein
MGASSELEEVGRKWRVGCGVGRNLKGRYDSRKLKWDRDGWWRRRRWVMKLG